ncbi:phenazine biosynthesis-like domain-containing protein [Oryctolagus cuniculus]|uniref:phenazine biosynthesis-like domain-containing protein n=1 Tax=Oryctolagus cuniculus TaxID=9986 RepID=UPI00387917C1
MPISQSYSRPESSGERAPTPSPAGSQAGLKNLRHRAAEVQRRPSASFVLDLGAERLRRHWLSCPSSGLSHLGNLRQKSPAVPPENCCEGQGKQLQNVTTNKKATSTYETAKAACQEDEAPYFHSRCIHSKSISWKSCCCLPSRKYNVNSTLTFVTLSGELRATRAEDGVVMDFPLYPAHPQDFHEVEALIKTAIGDTLVQDVRYSPDIRGLLVRLSDSYDRSFLENLKVNTSNLLQVENTGKVKGLILTLKGEPGGETHAFDFYSRYFAPWYGVAEDPVTGSAHTVLSSYWSQQLGKKEMRAFQCSCRGGELKLSLRSDGRVDIRGDAAVVVEGTLSV